MKLRSLILPAILLTVMLSSCLKDTPYMDVSNTQPIIEFGLSAANGYGYPLAFAGDTANGPAGITDTAVGLLIASPQVLPQTYTISVNVDTTQVSAYNAANDSNYVAMPANYYTIGDTTATIGAGYRIGRIPITINIPALPAHHRYLLPLAITNGDGLLISGNSGTFMWIFYR